MVGHPVWPVDRLAVERVGEVLEVDVPSGERKHDLVVGHRKRAAEPERAPIAVALQLPTEQPVDVGVDLEDRVGHELRDRAVHDRLIPPVVGVEPAENDVPADDGLDLRLGEPPDQLPGFGERGPDALDRMIEVTLEPEEVEPVAGLERAADGVGVQASARLR